MTKTFQPMLAVSSPDFSEVRFPTLASYKLDGIRCVIRDGVPFTRKLKRIPNGHIHRTLSKMNLPNLDGELLIAGARNFSDISSAVMSHAGWPAFEYHVFDLLGDNRVTPYRVRYQTLLAAVEQFGPPLHLVEHWVVDSIDDVQADFAEAVGAKYEGLILRHHDSPYKFGRSTAREQFLMKVKPLHDDEGKIVDFVEQMHNDNKLEEDERGYAKRSKAKEGLVPAGCLGAFVADWRGTTFEIGTGFSLEQRKKFWEQREQLRGKFVRFGYQSIGSKGRPLFPRFQAIRHAFDR